MEAAVTVESLHFPFTPSSCTEVHVFETSQAYQLFTLRRVVKLGGEIPKIDHLGRHASRSLSRLSELALANIPVTIYRYPIYACINLIDSIYIIVMLLISEEGGLSRLLWVNSSMRAPTTVILRQVYRLCIG